MFLKLLTPQRLG